MKEENWEDKPQTMDDDEICLVFLSLSQFEVRMKKGDYENGYEGREEGQLGYDGVLKVFSRSFKVLENFYMNFMKISNFFYRKIISRWVVEKLMNREAIKSKFLLISLFLILIW